MRKIFPPSSSTASCCDDQRGGLYALRRRRQCGGDRHCDAARRQSSDGALQLADFIGLDTCLSVMQVLYEGLADSKYRPCPLLVKYVEAGWLAARPPRLLRLPRRTPGPDAVVGNPLTAPEQNTLHVSASLSHKGRGESEFCIRGGKSMQGVPSSRVGYGIHTSRRLHPCLMAWNWVRPLSMTMGPVFRNSPVQPPSLEKTHAA